MPCTENPDIRLQQACEPLDAPETGTETQPIVRRSKIPRTIGTNGTNLFSFVSSTPVLNNSLITKMKNYLFTAKRFSETMRFP